MTKVFVNIGLTLDGYMAPEGMSLDHWSDPAYKNWGAKWGGLMGWILKQQYFRENLGFGTGGETGPVNDMLRHTMERSGVSIMGKRMFEQGEVSWPAEAPFHTPVYVLTNEKREPWVRPGGTTFHFVNDGPERALELARASAGSRDVRIAGGADVIIPVAAEEIGAGEEATERPGEFELALVFEGGHGARERALVGVHGLDAVDVAQRGGQGLVFGSAQGAHGQGLRAAQEATTGDADGREEQVQHAAGFDRAQWFVAAAEILREIARLSPRDRHRQADVTGDDKGRRSADLRMWPRILRCSWLSPKICRACAGRFAWPRCRVHRARVVGIANVHDFVWAADTDYKHTRLKRLDGLELHFFYVENERNAESWAKLPTVMDHAFNYINRHFGQYPYLQYSFIMGGDGGMEYPMATLITGNRPIKSLVGVSVHELMHSWFQMVLGTNESLYAWMDEGFTSYASTRVMDHLTTQKLLDGKPAENPFAGTYNGYINLTKSGLEEPLTTHADHFVTNYGYGLAAYTKGEVFLHQLEYVVGKEVFDRAILKYFYTWQFKHPQVNDLIRVFEKESEIEIDW